jgi:putative ABC transport system permease protein
MFRNYLATALRNLARNRLYVAISILGLAVAFAAAILIAQFVRNEFSYDRWIPGYQQVYKITSTIVNPGQPPIQDDVDQAILAGQLRAVFPGAEAIVRLRQYVLQVKYRPSDTAVTDHSFAWVDPDIFKVLPLPVLGGNLSSALQQADTVVITRNVARKYFHRDLPIGDILLVQVDNPPPQGGNPQSPASSSWHPMRVTAVLKDLPSNTNLTTEVFASARSAYSDLARMDARPPMVGGVSSFTFVRLSPKASATDLQRALDLATKPESALADRFNPGAKWLYHGVPLAEAHLTQPGLGGGAKPVGSRSVAYAIAGVGALIVLVAAINFVTLMTARAARRGVEVGIRKAAGAKRGDLMVQFIGEALIQVALAALIGMSVAELLLPAFSAFVQRGLTLDYLHDPWLLPVVTGVVLCVGLLAAVYPALVLSSFRPAAALKGGVIQGSGSPLARSALVVVQFAILVGLIVTTTTIYRQTKFALAQGLGTVDSKLIVGVYAPCNSAFPDEVRKLRGVSAAACSSLGALSTVNSISLTNVQFGGGRKAAFDVATVDFGFFQLYGVKPLAGRLFLPDHGEDRVLADPKTAAQPTVILNETAARNLGFSDPHAAIGRRMSWGRSRPGAAPAQGPPPSAPSEIIGVVPDMPATVRVATDPTFYYVIPKQLGLLSIKMTGQDIPGTVKAIEATWKRAGNGQPIFETFLSQSRLTLYLDLIIQGVTIGICAALAVLIACLGLFALSAYTTERRTKEIGIRKVMGASTQDIVRLLVWQFTIPVLWSIAIALPVGFLVMNYWLHQFAYRVQLSVWTFVLAAVAAVAIAWLTVAYQSYIVARAKPAGALQYE